MDSRSAVAIFAPKGNHNGCYKLTRAQKVRLAEQLRGVPVTYEHKGIHAALNELNKCGAAPTKQNVVRGLSHVANKGNPSSRPIGLVTDAWVTPDGDAMCAFQIKGNAAGKLMETGALGSVSLTHYSNGGNDIPLEVSLCADPARAGARIVASQLAPYEVAVYKTQTQRAAKSATNMSAAEAPMDTSDNAADTTMKTQTPKIDSHDAVKAAFAKLGQIDPDAQLVVASQLKSLMEANKASDSKLKEAASKTQDLEQKLDQANALMNTDADILGEQLKILLESCPEDIQRRYSMMSVPETVKLFREGSKRQILDAALRTVVCASRTLQFAHMPPSRSEAPVQAAPQQRVVETPTVKRVRSAETHEPASQSNEDILADALNIAFG